MEKSAKNSNELLQSLSEEARDLLSQEQPDMQRAATLASQLRNQGRFAYAAELYLLLLDLGATKENRDDYLYKLVHCLYKDPDLPSSAKFDFAIRYLGELDVLKKTANPEVLGRMGAIYKYKWQYDNQYRNLLFSRHYYERGYQGWYDKFLKKSEERKKDSAGKPDVLRYDGKKKDSDTGYTAINYAFVLELMANVRLDLTAKLDEAFSENVKAQLETAKLVREEIIAYFGAGEHLGNTNRPDADFGSDWVYATIGEAYFGLGEFDKAQKFYGWYVEKKPSPDRWQIDSAAKQLTALAQILIQLADFRSKQEEWGGSKKDKYIFDVNQTACDCLAILYGSCLSEEKKWKTKKELPDVAMRGKVGLALSGGGIRAALFHIGVLARLAELNVLRHVEALSCVSGGSIVGAYYYLLLKQKLDERDDELEQKDYTDIVTALTVQFLKATQQNIRVRILSSFRKNLRIFFDPDYTRTHRLGELYEEILYRKLVKKADDLLIHNLRINPGGDKDFDIKMENWDRKNKVPILVLNATSLNTGHNWQFTASWMGEPPGSIQQQVDSKPRLRRMYYKDAPEKYRNKIRLGLAVGASSCVPALFEPLLLRDLYPNLDLMLADGGVQDNQGVSSLLEQECKVLIVSDSSGQLPNEATLGTGAVNSFFRSDMVLQEKVREHQLTDLFKRKESSQLNGLFYLHLKKDLHANPVRWKFSKEPTRKIWLKQGFAENVNLTSYETLKTVQEHLANLRTDLDAFNDAEAYALMYSGYCQAKSECEQPEFKTLFKKDIKEFEKEKEDFQKSKEQPTVTGEENVKNPERDWNFLKITHWMTDPEQSEKLLKRLNVGKSIPFKVFKINRKMRLLAKLPILLLAGLGVGAIYLGWQKVIGFDLAVRTVAFTLLTYLVGIFVSSSLSRLISYKSTLLRAVFFVIGALFLSIASKAYLWWLNQKFLNWGKIKNLDKEDKPNKWLKWLRNLLNV